MHDTTQPPVMPGDEATIVTTSIGFREQVLLFIAGLFILAISSGLIAARGHNVADYWHFGVWIICAVLGHIALRRYLPHRDPFLFPVVMLLAGWGLVLSDRLAPASPARP